MVTDMEQREKRVFWVINAGNVQQAEGYSCGVNGPKYWWFPTLGMSMCEGYHVFPDRVTAERNAVAQLQAERARIEAKLASYGR